MKSTPGCSKGSVPFTWIPGGFCLSQGQHWPVSRQCRQWDFVLHRRREPRNIFKLALPIYHGLDGSFGVFGLPEWVPAPPLPIICHLANPTIPFKSWWPLLLWLIGFGLQCILESLVFLPGESEGWGSLVGCRLWVTQSQTRLKWLSSSSVSSGSSTNMRALIGASLVTPKPLAACLAVLSASLFPEPGG